MSEMMKELYEHFEVIGVASGGIGMSYVNIDHTLRIIILVGTCIFVWRRALKRRRKNKDHDTTTL